MKLRKGAAVPEPYGSRPAAEDGRWTIVPRGVIVGAAGMVGQIDGSPREGTADGQARVRDEPVIGWLR